MLNRKLPCPSCGVGLKIADDLPSGRKITCPKCGQGFSVPEGNGQAHAPKPAAIRARKPASLEEDEEREEEPEEELEERQVARKRHRRPAEEEEDSDDEVEERPLRRKRRKLKKKKPSRLPLILGLVAGVLVLLVAVGVTFAVIKFWPSDKKADQIASNSPRSGPPSGPPSGPSRRPPGADQGSSEAGAERSSPPATQDSPTLRPSQPRPDPNSSDQSSAGKEVFQRSCARCHRIGESSGGRQGPDLAAIGQRRDADWLMKFIRDPQSLKPNSRMRPQRLNDEDLRAVAAYLASLK